jgi:hypothetical protein
MLHFGLEDWILWSRGQMTQVPREQKDCAVFRLA